MCITKACHDPTAPGVWWRDDAEWKQYDAASAAAILRGTANRANRVELGTLVSHQYGGGAQYVVDLRTLQQINLVSGFTRDVKVVKAPTAARATFPRDASAATASNKDGGRVCQEGGDSYAAWSVVIRALTITVDWFLSTLKRVVLRSMDEIMKPKLYIAWIFTSISQPVFARN